MLSVFDLLQLPMPMARTFRVAGRSPLQRGRCAYLRGRTTVKHVPVPALLETVIFPWWVSATLLAMASIPGERDRPRRKRAGR